MIKVVAKNFAEKDKVDEILVLCKELVEATRKEEGCTAYELCKDENDSTILTFIEEWESKEALESHMKTEHFTRIVPLLGKRMTKESEMNVYTKLL